MVLRCPQCGKPNPDYAKHCHFDGQSLTGIGSPPPLVPATPSVPVAPPSPPPAPTTVLDNYWLLFALCFATGVILVSVGAYRHFLWALLALLTSLAAASGVVYRRRTALGRVGWKTVLWPVPKTVGWAVGSLVGMGLALGVSGVTRPPSQSDELAATEAKPLNGANGAAAQGAIPESNSTEGRVAAGASAAEAPPAAGKTPKSPEASGAAVRVSLPQPPEDIPLLAFVNVSPFLVTASTGYATGNRDNSWEKAVDGREDTYWKAGANEREPWFEIGFGGEFLMDGLVIRTGGSDGACIRSARLEFGGGLPETVEFSDSTEWQLIPFSSRRSDRVRLVVTAAYPKDGRAAPVGISEIWLGGPAAFAPAQSQSQWAGAWRNGESFGVLMLTQVGDWVRGTYSDGQGRFVGRASGKQVHAHWNFEGQTGEALLTMDSNGKSFTGQWRSSSAGDWITDSFWTGSRP